MEAQAPPTRSSRGRLLVLAGFAGVLVLVVLFAVPLFSRPSADAAARFSDALGAPATVTLGHPVLVEATDVPMDGTTAVLRSLRLELTGVAGLDDPGATVTAEAVRFVAELDDDAVQLLVGVIGRIPLTDIELRGGFARLVFAGMPVVDATADTMGETVVLRPTTPFLGERVAAHVALDGLPLGLRPEAAEIRRGALRVSGSGHGVLLRPERDPLSEEAICEWYFAAVDGSMRHAVANGTVVSARQAVQHRRTAGQVLDFARWAQAAEDPALRATAARLGSLAQEVLDELPADAADDEAERRTEALYAETAPLHARCGARMLERLVDEVDERGD